jgi:hypothetical protein
MKNINERMESEEELLHNLYGSVHFKNRIYQIIEVVVNEFWTPESFNHSENYCQHMMFYKESIIKILKMIFNNETEYADNLFKFVMTRILDTVSFYNKVYTDLYFKDEKLANLKCKCPVCS